MSARSDQRADELLELLRPEIRSMAAALPPEGLRELERTIRGGDPRAAFLTLLQQADAAAKVREAADRAPARTLRSPRSGSASRAR